jgi:hypothetical protein
MRLVLDLKQMVEEVGEMLELPREAMPQVTPHLDFFITQNLDPHSLRYRYLVLRQSEYGAVHQPSLAIKFVKQMSFKFVRVIAIRARPSIHERYLPDIDHSVRNDIAASTRQMASDACLDTFSLPSLRFAHVDGNSV